MSYAGERLDDLGVFYVKGVAFSLPPPDARWGTRNFPDAARGLREIEVVPSFNSVLIFATASTSHGVTPVTTKAGERRRHSVTVFYLEEGDADLRPDGG